jgi:hypothetical protein
MPVSISLLEGVHSLGMETAISFLFLVFFFVCDSRRSSNNADHHAGRATHTTREVQHQVTKQQYVKYSRYGVMDWIVACVELCCVLRVVQRGNILIYLLLFVAQAQQGARSVIQNLFPLCTIRNTQHNTQHNTQNTQQRSNTRHLVNARYATLYVTALSIVRSYKLKDKSKG